MLANGYTKLKIISTFLITPFILTLFFVPVKAQIQTFTISSQGGSNTKINYHELTNISEASDWLNYGLNDSSWKNSREVWDSGGLWKEVSFDPNTMGNAPRNNEFYFLNRSYAKVISERTDVQAPSGYRMFYRTKFTLPENIKVTKAILYASGDNVHSHWINGTSVGGKNGVLNNGGCGPVNDAAGYEGGIFTLDVTDLVVGGNNILASNIVNTQLCGQRHPVGLQFYLVVQYDDNPQPDNNPPVCGTLIKNPNQSNYLPQSSISLSANATDPDGDNLLYTNWQVISTLQASDRGYFTTSTAQKNVTYRAPKLATTETVVFMVSDGKTTVQCQNPISTKETFRCSETNQCVLDPNGSFGSFQECSNSCQTKYTCNSNNQCVVSTNGQYSSIGACQEECKADVSCNAITFNKGTNTATVSANVNNFTSDSTNYTWSSTYSSNSFTVPSINNECNSLLSCTMLNKNTSYTLPAVTYTLPPAGVTDTITLRINNDPNNVCTYEVGGKDIILDIEKSNYTTSVGGTVTAKLIVTPTSMFNEPYNIYLNCPGQICRFKDINIGDGLQRQIDYSKVGERRVQVFDFTITGVTPNAESLISANGYATVSTGDNYTRSDTAIVNVTSAKSLAVEVKEVSNFSASSPLAYCDNFSSGELVNRDSISKIDIRSGPNTSFYNGSLPLPSAKQKIPNGDYTFYITGTEPGFSDSKEVYCTKVITDASQYDSQRAQSSFTLTSSDTNVKLIAVVGPKISTGWFKAFGGNGYAFSDFNSKVPLGQRLFSVYNKISDGFVTLFGENANFSGLDNSRTPEFNIKNYEQQNQLAQFIFNFEQAYTGPNFTGSKTINSLADIDKSADKTIFYVYKGDLTFDGNFEINANAKVPVIYVKSEENGNGGTVTINENVQQLDLYIIADKDVFIDSKQTTCSPEKERLSTSSVDYRVHTFRRYVSGEWLSVSFRSTIPVVGDLTQTGDMINGAGPFFTFNKPENANYAEVKPYWVQSGNVRQDNEFIKYTTTLNSTDGSKSVICGDIDGDTDPLTWSGGKVNGVEIPAYPNNIHKQYECGEIISGNVTGSQISVVPTFPEELVSSVCTISPTNPSNVGCNGSSVANVEVTWYKVTTPDASKCSNTLNLKVNGAIISNQNIDITPNSPNTQQTTPSEEFYYSPDPLFSDDSSADGFKVVNIYLKSLD